VNKNIRTALAASAALALTLSVTACGRDSTSGTSSDNQQVTIALSTLNNPFFVDLRDGALAEAEVQGITLNVLDAQDDAATQANQIQTAVTAKTAALIINPVDSDAATAAVKPALDGNLPIVAVDRGVTGVDVDSFIASDNVAGGAQAADALAKAIGEKGKVIWLQGTAGTSASRDRGSGFETQIATYSGITVVAKQTADFDRTEGLDVTTNLMQANPDVVGIFAENDEMALGAVQALGSKAGTTVFVVGFDGSDDGLKAVQSGTMVATVAQQPKELGKAAVDAIAKLLKGETVDATQSMPVVTVTSDNISDYIS
jgi:ribose transport system substrate-binding protein